MSPPQFLRAAPPAEVLTMQFPSILKLTALMASLFAVAFAQNNPVPQIVGPVHPDAIAPAAEISPSAFTVRTLFRGQW